MKAVADDIAADAIGTARVRRVAEAVVSGLLAFGTFRC